MINIYLAGGMTGLSFEEQCVWRSAFESAMYYEKDDARIFNPVRFYNFEAPMHLSEKEIMEFDLNLVKKSDVIVCNFNSPNSIGTAMELSLAKYLGIPIIGLNEDEKEIHPWLKESCMRIETDLDSMVQYIKEYFITAGRY